MGGDTGNAENAEAEDNRRGAGNGEEALQQAASLQDWQGRMQASVSNVTVRSSSSQTYAAIRHTTVSYIFDLLFTARRNRLNQWRQQNGTRTGDSAWYTQTQNTWQSSSSALYYQDGLAAGGGEPTARLRVLNYSQTVIQTESESTAFSTVGTVRTADGRDISFQVNVGMSRQFQQYFEQNQVMKTFTM